jgi:hypothetical protein
VATESSIALPPDSTGKKLRTIEVVSSQGTVEQQVVTLADPNSAAMQAINADGSINARTTITSPNGAAAGIFAMLNAYGAQRVSVEPSVIFMEPFDGTLDTTNRWVTGGTAPALSGGALAINPGTAASATSRLTSQPAFASPGLGFEILATVVQIEAATTANVYRFWGWASDSGAPTYQAPSAANGTAVLDAVGFELDGSGTLYAVVYANGVNTFRLAVNPATWKDGTYHRYAIFKRSDIVFWYVEGQELPVASSAYHAPNVQALPLKFGAYNNATAPAAYTFNVNAAAVCDSTAQNQTLSDGNYPWRKASMTVGSGKTALDVNIAGSAAGIADTTGTFTNVANSAVTAAVGNAGNCTISLIGGSFVGLPLIFEASTDGGTTYFTVDATQADGTGVNTQIVLPANGGPRNWNIPCPGYTHVRVRMTTTATTFTTTPTVLIKQGGFLYDPSPTIAPIDGQKATYSVAITGMAANLNTDIFQLVGSATRTVRITRVEVGVTGGGTITSAGTAISLIKRTTLTTGGTAATTLAGKYDTADPATTCTSSGYTAAPTIGAYGAHAGYARWQMAAASAWWEWNFGTRAKAPVLRSATESFVINNSAVAAGTSPTLTWSIFIEYTEE